MLTCLHDCGQRPKHGIGGVRLQVLRKRQPLRLRCEESYTAGPMQWLRMNASETAGYQAARDVGSFVDRFSASA